jgi:AcrR family transcriptional regulator
MKNENLTFGRVDQKRKTRDKILKIAEELLNTVGAFSLEDVAEKAQISRATIYRYYSNIEILCAEVVITINTKSTDELIKEVENMNKKEALLYIQNYFNDLANNNEAAFRKYLSIVVDETLKNNNTTHHRGARRLIINSAILEKHKNELSAQNLKNLKYICTVLAGIEPLIANKDVNHISNEESKEILNWALQMILKGIEADEKVNKI